MKVYMVLQQNKEGGIEFRIGGGSSTPKGPKVYDTLAKARAYSRDKESTYIAIVDLDRCSLTI